MAKAETYGFPAMIDGLKFLSAPELAKLIAAAQRERETKVEEERQKLQAIFKEQASKLDMTVEDVMRESATPKKKIGAVYRGPNGEEWSGRGKVPKWLTSLEAQGRNRDEFRL